MKKKILFIANEIQVGGASNSLFQLACSIKKNYTPIILVNKKGPLTKRFEQENIKYIVLKYKPYATGEGSSNLKKIIKKILLPYLKISHSVLNNLALKKINKLINMDEISLIHTNVNRDDFGILLSKKYNIPHIMHLREFGDIDYKLLYLRKDYIDFVSQNTKYFIAISNVIKEHFIKKGFDKDKIKVIYNGVKINPNPKPDKNKNLNILFLGGIQESKGQLELIEALNLIPKEIPVKVDFYGMKNYEYKKLLINKIKEYHLKNIYFNSYINDVNSIMHNYNIGIMCSRKEAFGRVIVEYMTNKLITIVPNKGACVEIVSKDSGFIYEYGNYNNLACILTKIYNMDLKDRQKIIDNGYKRAKYFSVENNAKNIMKLYESI